MKAMLPLLLPFMTIGGAYGQSEESRPRAREAGVVVGITPTGPNDAITDVDGVLVGHATVIAGDSVRTGVTPFARTAAMCISTGFPPQS